MSERTYIKNTEWNKSKTLLFPLLYDNKIKNDVVQPVSVYSIFEVSPTEKYQLLNSYLTCTFKKDSKTNLMSEDTKVEAIRHIDSDTIAVVYNISKYKEVVDLFIKGKYSKFPEAIKSHIYKYYQAVTSDDPWDPNDKQGILIDVILYPEKYWDLVAEELHMHSEVLKNIGELSSPPDFVNKEKLKL